MRRTMTILLMATSLACLSVAYNGAFAQSAEHDNQGSNGCVKSSERSKACEKNPNTEISDSCIWYTLDIVEHPETGEYALKPAGRWEVGDIAVFDSGAICIVDTEVPPGTGV